MKNREEIKTDTYTNFPFYNEDGEKVDELFFSSYKINEYFPEKGIVVLSRLSGGSYTFFDIDFSSNINELIKRKSRYISSNGINRILVGECDYNDEAESYIIKIQETKNINSRF